MFVVCKEHLELAIDRFVDEYEDAPDVVDVEKTHFKNWNPPPTCEEKGCACQAQFLVV